MKNNRNRLLTCISFLGDRYSSIGYMMNALRKLCKFSEEELEDQNDVINMSIKKTSEVCNTSIDVIEKAAEEYKDPLKGVSDDS